jgi:hypothetical protein
MMPFAKRIAPSLPKPLTRAKVKNMKTKNYGLLEAAKNTPVKTVTLVFYSEKDHREIARVDLPPQIIAAIKRACRKRRTSFKKFIILAIKHKVNVEATLKNLIAGGVR